jgi:septum site-determining protein MinC
MASSLSEPPFELKGSVFTLSVLRLREMDLRAIGVELDAKIRQAPAFFHKTPVVLDLGLLSGSVTAKDFFALSELLRVKGLIPVGARKGDPEIQNAAMDAGLAVLPESSRRAPPQRSSEQPEPVVRERPKPEREPSPAKAERAAPASDGSGEQPKTVVVTRPVRSGQQVYAESGDLLALKTVSAGAEVVAHGNIQVLGPLRGRALAGAHGDDDCHIVCQSLEAELVSIAGRYRVFEELDSAVRGRAVHIYLRKDRLHIETI